MRDTIDSVDDEDLCDDTMTATSILVKTNDGHTFANYTYVLVTNPSIAMRIAVRKVFNVVQFIAVLALVVALSVITIVPAVPAALFGGLVQGVIHGWSSLDSEELTPTFWWGFGVFQCGLIGIPLYFLLMRGKSKNVLSLAECKALRTAKLKGRKTSFTSRQMRLDAWLSIQEEWAKVQVAQDAAFKEKQQEETRQAIARANRQNRSSSGSRSERGGSGSSSPLPAPRDAEHFEEICATFLKRLGHGGVMRTPTGPDGGIDVISNRAVGQAKFHPSQKVPAEPVRALAGSRQEHGRQEAYFFHYGPGYSEDAIRVGRKLGVKLYEFDAQQRIFCRRA